MVHLTDIFAAKSGPDRPVVSLEFFPTRTEKGEQVLFESTIPQLMALKPDFFSVTYGAGGSTRDKTLLIVDRIQKEHGVPGMAHLTCVNATRQDIVDFLEEARSLDIKNILALRGDPPEGQAEFQKTDGGFEYSYQLVKLLREMGGFSVATAGFPEGHIACKEGRHADWEHLKNKIVCGADCVVTQLFFDTAYFLEFRDHLRNHLGVTVPIIPGILPILNTRQIHRFTEMCGSKLPGPLLQRLEELKDDDEACTEFGIEFATRQAEELLNAGVPGIHLYTLNKVRSVQTILQNLGLA